MADALSIGLGRIGTTADEKNEEMTAMPLTNAELEALATEVGKFIRYWGFKQIHGRIWTHLYLSQDPLDAGLLMKRLNVSKALMSLSLNDLLSYQVIQEAGRSAKGTQTYVANPQVIDVILGVLHSREKRMLEGIEQAQRTLASLGSARLEASAINSVRLKVLGKMVRQAQQTLDTILCVKGEFKDWIQLNDAEAAF